MKLLIILRTGMPFKLNSGGRQAVFNTIDYLRNYIEISIFYWDDDKDSNEDKEKLKQYWQNVNFYAYRPENKIAYDSNTLERVFNKIRRILFSTQSYENSSLKEVEFPESYLLELSNVLSSENYDFVQTEFYPTLDLVYYLPENIKKIFVQHEIRYVRNKRFYNTKLHSPLRLLLNRQKFNEIQAMQCYDAVITLSDIDRDKLIEDNVNTKVFSSPVTIYPGKVHKSNYQGNICFLGGHNHPPNVEGVEWFLNNVWDKIINKNVRMKFFIVGKWPKSVRRRLQNKHYNVEFLGFVEDLGAVLSETIMVVPILTGSGVRMKILDAMYYGSPIVSTSVGIEGLGFSNGEDCYITDSSSEFARAIMKLDQCEELRQRLTSKSRVLFKERYSHKVLGEKRLFVYNKLRE